MKKFVLVSSATGSKTVGIDSLSASESKHRWVTVINPTNHRLLLQACDDCGVVKSENSIRKACRAPKGQSMVSGWMSLHRQQTA